MKMIEKLLRKFAVFFEKVEETDKSAITKEIEDIKQNLDFVNRSMYNLTNTINNLIEVNKEQQEILVMMATTQDEILNIMNDELQLQEAQEGEIVYHIDEKDPGALN